MMESLKQVRVSQSQGIGRILKGVHLLCRLKSLIDGDLF